MESASRKNFRYQILTPTGWSDFSGVKKTKKEYKISLATLSYSLECTPDHLIKLQNGEFKTAKSIRIFDKIRVQSGYEVITSKNIVKCDEYFYDALEVSDNHEYYTDGIVSHNCAFLGSSGTLISGQALRELTYTTPISQVDGLSIFEEPYNNFDLRGSNMNHQYAICCDVSRGKGLDYSAFSVIDITQMPYKQVCTYRNNTIPPVEYAEIIFRIGKHYNNAVVLVEINDLGQQTVDHLFEMEYDNILYTENAGRAGKKISLLCGKNADRGIRTTTGTKATGCAILKLLIEQKQLIISDFETIEELSRFSRKGNSYEAEPNSHDDLVMGLVIFAWLSDQNFFKELTDINTISRLRERSEEELASQLTPLGVFSDGLNEQPGVVTDIGYDSFDNWMLT